MPLSSNVLALFGGAGVVAYLAYEYKEKLQLTKKFKAAVADILSADLETQIISIETVAGHIANNKALTKDLCEEGDALRELAQLIFSGNDEARLAAVELLAIISQDFYGLEAIRQQNLFQPIVAVLSFPFASDDLLDATLVAIKNCTTPSHQPAHPTGKSAKAPFNQVPRADPSAGSAQEEYESEGAWFARELCQQNGLEPLVNKLLSDDPDIQSLTLEIIINYCKTMKDQDAIGQLGGIGFMLEIFTSKTSPPDLQTLALSALRHCVQSCSHNAEQFRNNDGVKVIVSYFKNDAPKTIQGTEKQEDILNSLKILTVTSDSSTFEHIRTEQVIPIFVQYFMQGNKSDIKNNTVALLKHLAQADPKCRKEISDTFKKETRMGNAGVPPQK